jgi:hypothetical protein
MCSYLRTASNTSLSGTELEVARFDAMENSSAISVLGHNTVTSVASGQLTNPAISFDYATQSHWALVYEQSSAFSSSARIARLGYTGGVVESALLGSRVGPANFDPAVTLYPAGQFMVAYTDDDPGLGYPVLGQVFGYYPEAVNVEYGSSCGGRINASNPYAGSEFFHVNLNSAAPSTPAWLFIAAAPANIDLAAINMPGCALLVDPTLHVALPAITSSLGTANHVLSLPDDPVVTGDLFLQWFHTSTAGTLATTPGLRCQVR